MTPSCFNPILIFINDVMCFTVGVEIRVEKCLVQIKSLIGEIEGFSNLIMNVKVRFHGVNTLSKYVSCEYQLVL